MSFDAPRESAETIMEAWGGLPIAYDNVNFDSQAHKEWLSITILNGDSFETAIGANCVKHTGVIEMQIFTTQWGGSARARLIANEVSNLFKGLVDDGVIYRAGVYTRVGHESDFYQGNLTIPWELTETA